MTKKKHPKVFMYYFIVSYIKESLSAKMAVAINIIYAYCIINILFLISAKGYSNNDSF